MSAILDELDKQAQMRATNNLALSGSKTAMASAADDMIPTANPAGTMGHGAGALSMLAGGELGSHIGGMIGQGEAGAIAGAAGGTLWNKGVAPLINASRTASQNASRMALAKALTNGPTQDLADALARRTASKGVRTGATVLTGGAAKTLGLAAAPVAAQQLRQPN